MRTPDDEVVRVAIEGDEQLAQAYLPAALALLRRTQERRRLGHLAQLSAQARLDDQAYAYVTLAGGINSVHLVVADGREAERQLELVSAAIPDFLSGTVTNGYIVDVPADPPRAAYRTLDAFHPSQAAAVRYKLPFALQEVQRLAVEPSDDLASELSNPKPENGRVFSQYARLKPTMFSGTMRTLVQVLMGFGRSRIRNGQPVSLYDEPARRREAPLAQPSAYTHDVAKNGLRIRYDWRFTRTHGVTFAADGSPWLVEIGISQGVLAMPLPVNPRTTSVAFRRRLEKLGDQEALAIVDRFGGFPTGEPFPPSAQIPAWIRAGRVLRMATHDDLAPFYAHTAYSTQMGWAFNARGDEAHNTAWRYGDDDVQRGVHFMLPIQISALAHRPASTAPVQLRTALVQLRGGDGVDDILDAALWKIDRLDADQRQRALEELDRYGARSALTYVDELVLPPLASGTSPLSRVSEGTLWYPPRARFETGSVARWPEPQIGLLVAHSMKPASDTAVEPSRCDTTVHVFFVENELKWVKFFRDRRSTPGTSTDDFEQCMYIGQWSQHIDGGSVALPPMFYTNDLDDRVELAESTIDMKITGIDLGYCRITANDDILDPSEGVARRVKRFQLTMDSTTVTSPTIMTGVAVPFYDREACYYAVYRGSAGTSHTVSASYTELTDPYYCGYKRNFPGYYGIYTGAGTATDPWRPLRLFDVNGFGPNEYRTANPGSPLYDSSNACRDIADSGPWVTPGENIDARLYSIPPPPLPASVNQGTGPTGHYDVYLVSSNGLGTLLTRAVDSTSFSDWELPSPDAGDGFSSDQYLESLSNAAGDAVSARYSITINGGGVLRGLQWDGMSSGQLTYIGVIHG